MSGLLKMGGGLLGFFVVVAIIWQFESTQTRQIGYDGVAMQVTDTETRIADRQAINKVPPVTPIVPSGPLAADAYENVQVLGHLTTGEFVGVMNAITAWVSPAQGCNYCHNAENLALDDKYTKIVSRRMLQMTMHINEKWTPHVKETGVTCWTCHRGQPVPRYVWFEQGEDPHAGTYLGNRAFQNDVLTSESLATLPTNYLDEYLLRDKDIRVQSTVAMPNDNKSSIKQAEWTYGLMMHFSRSLGVNCTYCHNSRSWADWSQSPVQRSTAWYGIRMARQLNNEWLVPLTEVFPPNRLGPLGDAPKLNCATCHQGAYKPLLGQPMAADYPFLQKAMPQPERAVLPADGSAVGAAP
ncbi:MAG: photosynthetic reaction center cytochrome PufC [Nannocystaceae bacterium]